MSDTVTIIEKKAGCRAPILSRADRLDVDVRVPFGIAVYFATRLLPAALASHVRKRTSAVQAGALRQSSNQKFFAEPLQVRSADFVSEINANADCNNVVQITINQKTGQHRCVAV